MQNIKKHRGTHQARVMRSAVCSGLLAVLFTAAAALAEPQTARLPNDSYLLVGAGMAGVLDDQQAMLGVAEARLPRFWHRLPLAPWVGLHVSDEEIYLAGGLRLEWFLTERLFLIPSFGAGFYEHDSGVRLGHTIEFRSGAETGLRFSNGMRLAVAFHHVSNAGADEINPGSEFVMVLFGTPLPWPRR